MNNPTLRKLQSSSVIAQSFFDLKLTREGVPEFLPDVDIHYLEIRNLRFVQASLIEKEIVDAGGGIAFDKNSDASPESVDIIIFAKIDQYQMLFKKLHELPFGLNEIAVSIQNEFTASEKALIWSFKDTTWYFGAIPKIMGILNVTPDSFSDGGTYLELEHAVSHATKMISEGADIIDIGGQSTRPGSLQVSADEEMKRVVPVVKGIRTESSTPISIDTYYSSVARAALAEGADIVNDVSSCTVSPDMPSVVGEFGAGLILMHKQGNQTDMQNNPIYSDVVAEIISYLKSRVEYCIINGVKNDSIVVDPGIGFGKTLEHNLTLIKNLDKLRVDGRPVLLGHSRKSFIGEISDNPVDDRDFESIIISTLVADRNSADIIRVHEVEKTHRALSLLEKLNCSIL